MFHGGLAPAVDRCVEAYAAGRPLLLLFDYDGTLAPLRRRPDQARIPSPTRQLLTRLARRPRVAVGIISGRSLDDLRRMCLLEGLVYVGTAGLEWDLFGTRGSHPQARRLHRTMAVLNRRLARVVAPFAGAWVENKHLALTVHYREVPDEEVPSLLERVEAAVAPYRPSVCMVPAPEALEIYPEVGWDKGGMVRWLAEQIPGSQPLILYAGDAANDQPALEAVEALGGVAVAVGAQVRASYWVPGPRAICELLAGLEAKLPFGSPPRPATPGAPT